MPLFSKLLFRLKSDELPVRIGSMPHRYYVPDISGLRDGILITSDRSTDALSRDAVAPVPVVTDAIHVLRQVDAPSCLKRDPQNCDTDKNDELKTYNSSGDGAAQSTAYIIQSSNVPNLVDIKILLEKVEKFKILSKSDVKFSACAVFVPVLAGRHWHPSVFQACIDHKISTVTPSGVLHHSAVSRMSASVGKLGYTFTRNFSTLLKRFLA